MNAVSKKKVSKKSATPSQSSDFIVEPSIYIDKHVNAGIEVVSTEIIRSIGLKRIPLTNTYVSYVIESQGDKILRITVEEPNLRGIAEESAKISFVNTFMGGDLE